MTGFLPVIAALQRPFGIHQDVSNVLRVADLVVAFADLEQRIVGRAGGICWIKQKYGSKPRTPAGGQLEILTLDVVDNRGIGPCQEGRDDEANTLSRPGRRKTQDVLGTVMPQVAAAQTAKHDAVEPQKPRTTHLSCVGPTR